MQFHAVDSTVQFSLGTIGEGEKRQTHFIDAFSRITFRANGSLQAITFATVRVPFSFLFSFSLLSKAMGVRLSGWREMCRLLARSLGLPMLVRRGYALLTRSPKIMMAMTPMIITIVCHRTFVSFSAHNWLALSVRILYTPTERRNKICTHQICPQKLFSISSFRFASVSLSSFFFHSQFISSCAYMRLLQLNNGRLYSIVRRPPFTGAVLLRSDNEKNRKINEEKIK